MDDMRIGKAMRAIRVERRLRQTDVAVRARVPRQDVIRIEQGRLGRMPLDRLRAVAAVLEASVPIEVRWRGADLDRLLASGHAALHEMVGGFLATLAPWVTLAEVSFAIAGERGVIDILAFHPPSGCLLIVELKTALGDPQVLVATMDRRMRLARRIAAERGWRATSVSAWVVITDTRTNRRVVGRHATLLRGRFPADGRAMRRWLAAPAEPILALSFWSDRSRSSTVGVAAPVRRVRPRHGEAPVATAHTT